MNIEELKQVIEHIEAFPETHNQGEWRCGTGMCFAGWLSELNPEVRWRSDDPDFGAFVVRVDGEKLSAPYRNSSKQSAVHVGAWAETVVQAPKINVQHGTICDLTADEARLLGWEEGPDFYLFASSNTRQQLAAAVEIIEQRLAKKV